MSTGYTPSKGDIYAPVTGSFPLDRAGQCKSTFKKLAMCWKQKNYRASECSKEAIAYLQCRKNCHIINQDDLFPETEDDWKNFGMNADSKDE